MANYQLNLEQMHPGVVNRDAKYKFYITKDGKRFCQDGDAYFLLQTDDLDVKVNGTEIIVPYFVRQEKRSVVINAIPNDYMKVGYEGIASYTLKFETAFGEQPSFYDDFETYDLTKWQEGWDQVGRRPVTGGWVENGDLVLELDGKEYGFRTISTADSFSQAFGCFTASIKFPEMTNTPVSSNCAFWLASNTLHPENIMFKRNPCATTEKGTQHAGEIDIMEYSCAFGDNTSASLFYYGWCNKNSVHSGMSNLPAPGIRDGNYHEISLSWVPGAIYWYFDGELIRVYDSEDIADVGLEPGAEMVVILQHNHAPAETWIGNSNYNKYPIQMRVDWVKVYALK